MVKIYCYFFNDSDINHSILIFLTEWQSEVIILFSWKEFDLAILFSGFYLEAGAK
jgi:hypothetical protein